MRHVILSSLAIAALVTLTGCAAFGGGDGAPTAAEIASLAMVTPAAGESAEQKAAARSIEDLGARAMAILGDASLTRDDRVARFRDLIERELDIPLIARFALGRYWRAASDEQRQAYLAAFARFIVRTYASQLGGAGVTGFAVTRAQPAGSRDFLVFTRVSRSDGAPIDTAWRLRRRDGRYLIVDLVVEGVSMALTRRQEFAAFIRADGDDIDGLIARLKGSNT